MVYHEATPLLETAQPEQPKRGRAAVALLLGASAVVGVATFHTSVNKLAQTAKQDDHYALCEPGMVWECHTPEACTAVGGVWNEHWNHCGDPCAAATYWGCQTKETCDEVGYQWIDQYNYCDAHCGPDTYWSCYTAEECTDIGHAFWNAEWGHCDMSHPPMPPGDGPPPCKDDYDEDPDQFGKPWGDFISCEDEAPYCHEHPDTLMIHCALTCGVCHVGPPCPHCDDEDDDHDECEEFCEAECDQARRMLQLAGDDESRAVKECEKDCEERCEKSNHLAGNSTVPPPVPNGTVPNATVPPPVTNATVPPPVPNGTFPPPVPNGTVPPPVTNATVPPPVTNATVPPPVTNATVPPPVTNATVPPSTGY